MVANHVALDGTVKNRCMLLLVVIVALSEAIFAVVKHATPKQRAI